MATANSSASDGNAPDDERAADQNQGPSWNTGAFCADVKDDQKSDPGNNSASDADGAPYEPSSLTSCPPLLRLQAYGFCCPFLETEEEHDARVCVNHLQNYPITWYREKMLEDVANDVNRVVGSSTTGEKIMGGINQMFGGNAKKRIPMSYVGVPATLSVVDTDNHGPIIEIRTLDMKNPSVVNDYITSGKPWWEDQSLKDKPPSKIVPMYMVDKVASGWSVTGDSTAGGVKIYAAPPSKGFLSGLGPELLRFDTLGGGGSSLMDKPEPNEPNKYSGKVILQLKSLVAWNRRRMARGIKQGTMGVVPKPNSPGYVAMA